MLENSPKSDILLDSLFSVLFYILVALIPAYAIAATTKINILSFFQVYINISDPDKVTFLSLVWAVVRTGVGYWVIDTESGADRQAADSSKVEQEDDADENDGFDGMCLCIC